MNIFKKLLISSTIISFASPVISQVNANQKLEPSRDKKILEREILIAENDFQNNRTDTLKLRSLEQDHQEQSIHFLEV